MENELIEISRIGDYAEILKITPRGDANDISLVPEVLSCFENYLKQNVNYFIIDLYYFNELPPSLIVVLFEITAHVRRRGGEVYISNLNPTARQDIIHFKPLEYLNEMTSEKDIINKIVTKSVLKTSRDITRGHKVKKPEIRQTPSDRISEEFLEIPSKVGALYKACDFVVKISRNMGFDDTEVSKIKISVYEACINVIEHAYHSDPTKKVKVNVETFPDKLIISVFDKGSGFKVEDIKIFNAKEAVDNRKRGGMGIPIIKRSMDEVSYIRDNKSYNRLVMVKKLSRERGK
ncbi:ATP-binding protein [candidate division KSB1 bacterium]|nr:ATP-binding protein [candidate division KSB1 bacterium]